MKKIFTLILFLSITKVFAQSFEGTITWAMKLEITDPKKKAQFEDAQKQLNDPTTQAKMKELEGQLKDPQFKAMMENNPQLKAQIEKMMSAMKGGDINSMMPSSFVINVKNQDVLTRIDGGMFDSEVLYLKSKDQAYMLNREGKTYSPLSKSESKETSSDANVKISKTKETLKILNYNTTKYIVETQRDGKTLVQHIWTTTEIKDLDLSALSKQNVGRNQPLFYRDIQGVPLKMKTDVDGMVIETEVTSIKKESLDAANFVIPADWKETASMFR
jgi:hypothetical protein